MIRADVEILDLDPQQWGALHELILEGRAARRWAYVLHAEGLVVSTHPEGLPVDPGDSITGSEVLAERLHAAGGFDRVVVIDRQLLPSLALGAAEVVEPGGDLTSYREKVEDLYWASPAIATRPAPPANPWRQFRLLAEALGDALVHVRIYGDGGTERASLALHVSGGAVTRISSVSGSDEPHVVIGLEAEALVRALRSPDLVGELLANAKHDPRSRALSRLEAALPVPSTGAGSPIPATEGFTAHVS